MKGNIAADQYLRVRDDNTTPRAADIGSLCGCGGAHLSSSAASLYVRILHVLLYYKHCVFPFKICNTKYFSPVTSD